MTQKVIVYDTEFTTWPGAQDNNWAESWQHREIVQIAAIRFDPVSQKEEDEFSILIRPAINPVLSDFFIELTGITNEQVLAEGIDFPAALQKFRDFAGGSPCVSYGGDAVVIRENCVLNNLSQDFKDFDIRPWFQKEGAQFGIHKKTNSGKLAKTLGAEMNVIQEHNALHDVRSICAAYRFLISKGSENLF